MSQHNWEHYHGDEDSKDNPEYDEGAYSFYDFDDEEVKQMEDDRISSLNKSNDSNPEVKLGGQLQHDLHRLPEYGVRERSGESQHIEIFDPLWRSPSEVFKERHNEAHGSNAELRNRRPEEEASRERWFAGHGKEKGRETKSRQQGFEESVRRCRARFRGQAFPNCRRSCSRH